MQVRQASQVDDPLRFVRSAVRRLRSIASATADGLPWKWNFSTFAETPSASEALTYLGPCTKSRDAATLFFANPDQMPAFTFDRPVALGIPLRLTREWLLVPTHVRCIVDLRRPFESILAGWDAEARRRVRRLLDRGYSLEVLKDEADWRRIHDEMFVPYAAHRHGEHAHQYSWSDFLRCARRGRLTRLMLGDSTVGAELGIAYERGGKHLWSSLRFGFPEAVFTDPKRLSEANLISYYLHMKRSFDGGFDTYDMGLAPARPSAGLLQFKRRLFCALTAPREIARVSILLPRPFRARWLAFAPLFSIERRRLVLNLGAVSADTDDDLRQRFKQFRFYGLFKVRLYSERAIDQPFADELRNLLAASADTQFEICST